MESTQSDTPTVALKWGLAVLALMAALNVPWRFDECYSQSLGENLESSTSAHFTPLFESRLIGAGWPLRYAQWSLPHESASDAWQWLMWKPELLAIDLVIILAVAGFFAAMAYWSRHLATGMATTAVIVLIGYTYHQYDLDRRAADALAQRGLVYRTAIVPVRLARMVPSPSLFLFLRTRSVMLHRPNDECAAIAGEVPTLQALGLSAPLPSADQFVGLMDSPRLRQLIITGATIDKPMLNLIGKQTGLRHLRLTGCRGLKGSTIALGEMPNLESIDFSHSDFELSALNDCRWQQHLVELTLSPQVDSDNRLVLRGWPRLESLNLRADHSAKWSGVMSVSLKALPQLRALGLVTTQKTDLSIVDSPRLKEIRNDEGEQWYPGDAVLYTPAGLWLRSLHLDNVASLHRLSCYGLDLQQLNIRGAPNLIELVIDSGLYGQQQFQKHSLDQQETLSKLINDLAICDGPPIINLSSLPLSNIDLSPLAKNHRIRELKLAGTGVSGIQLEPLLTLPRLTSLDVRRCPITNSEANSVVERLPQLRDFVVDAEDYQKIEIVDRERLVQFTATPSLAASIVRISRSPNLCSELVLGRNLKELAISDAVSLRGLSVNGPVPAGARLDGLRDLHFLALGGGNVDDSLCTAIWRCPTLDHLTLAYANLSRDALIRIGELHDLATLILPGADVDDSITAHWTELKQLSEVNLSYTAISGDTIRSILALKNLQRLSISHTAVDRVDLRRLPEVTQLVELEVAGVGLEEDLLESVLGRRMLDRLDLSDCELSGRSVDLLTGPLAKTLIFLGVRECGLTEEEIRRIVAANPRLVIDVAGHGVSDGLMDELRRDNRILAGNDREGFLRHVGRLNQVNWATGDSPADNFPGRINVHQFVPPGPITAQR